MDVGNMTKLETIIDGKYKFQSNNVQKVAVKVAQ